MTLNKFRSIFDRFFGELFSTITFTIHTVLLYFFIKCNTGAQVCQGERI
jgi:hypothetical protein